MPVRLADRLEQARRRRFVGRANEQAVFESALAAPELPFFVLYVSGPGGIGKSALLRQYAAGCEQAGVPVAYLDAHHLDPSPGSFLTALALAWGFEPGAGVLDGLARDARRRVMLVDTYEVLAPLDTWLREVFLPQLPDDTLVVLAGRDALPADWRIDPGWQSLVHCIPLRNLSFEEGRHYLAGRGVPAEQHDAVLDFTHGHPLALSLVADSFAQRADLRFSREAAPDVVKTLIEHFAQKVPGPAHRVALEACALVRLTTEPLLAELLQMPDAHDLFEWLRGLSFVESGPLGLFPHDLAREALVAELRWRNPEWYAELHRRARSFYTTHLQQAPGTEQQRLLFDFVFLHRDNAVVRQVFEWQDASALPPDLAREEDWPAILALVEQHEGPRSAEFARFWLEAQPAGMLVFRDLEQQPIGFLASVALDQVDAAGRDDPAVAAALDFLQCRAPLRLGEVATLFRFWLARDGGQGVSSVQSQIFVNCVRHYLTMPGLAFHFLPVHDPDFWAPLFSYADLHRLPEADFTVDGRRYGVFGHDWRAVPPLAWLSLLADREIAAGPAAAAAPRPKESLVVLSEQDFLAAVREALRGLARPAGLRNNPLLRSRLVVERSGPGAPTAERIAVLQARIKEAAEAFQSNPKDAKLSRVLHHTYFQPAATQELAAELLDLPFSTYRRHLTTAVSRVSDLLWQWELQGT